jgi:hypothetical protein
MRILNSKEMTVIAWTMVVLVIACSLPNLAQQNQPTNEDLNSEVEKARADLRADKVAIITDAMNFTPEESSAFWPIYNKYEHDLSQLNDQRIALLKSYADKFNTLTDADAKKMANDAFNLESRRVDLRKQYFRKFNEKLPATTVARFFQLEHRLDLLIDLQIAAYLPPLLAKPSTEAHSASKNN